VRIRKRNNISKDSKYLDPKYDTAFVARLMSDDEDEVEEDGTKTGRFVLQPPLYRSKEAY
jgi:hypothetical protein